MLKRGGIFRPVVAEAEGQKFTFETAIYLT